MTNPLALRPRRTLGSPVLRKRFWRSLRPSAVSSQVTTGNPICVAHRSALTRAAEERSTHFGDPTVHERGDVDATRLRHGLPQILARGAAVSVRLEVLRAA